MVSNSHVPHSDTLPIQQLAARARAVTHQPLDESARQDLGREIKQLLEQENAVLVAHYYVDAALQDLAEVTGGCVADSLEMARFGMDHPASTVVVAGVRFMGENGQDIESRKTATGGRARGRVFLDQGCPADAFSTFAMRIPGELWWCMPTPAQRSRRGLTGLLLHPSPSNWSATYGSEASN